MTSSIVVPPKGTSLRGNTSFEPLSVKIGPTVRPGCRIEKKRQDMTEQDSQKSQKALYFTYLGRSSHWTDFHKNFHSSCRPRCNHVCKLLSWNFQGLRFYRGSNFPFSYWFFHGPYNSAALLRCLWLSVQLLRVLGVAFSNKLYISDHVGNIKCSQTLHWQYFALMVCATQLYKPSSPCLKKLCKIVFVRTSSNFHQLR